MEVSSAQFKFVAFGTVATWIMLIVALVGVGFFIEDFRDDLTSFEAEQTKPTIALEEQAPVPQKDQTTVAQREVASDPIRKTFTNAGGWGEWSDPVHCPADHYVCGLAQRVESPQGKGDDTAMNAVAFYCCEFR